MTAHPQDEPIVRDELEDEGPGPRASAATRIAIALGILVIGVVVLREGLAVRGDLSPSGPRFVPVVMGVLWLVLGVAHLIQVVTALRSRSTGSTTSAGSAESTEADEGGEASIVSVPHDHAEGIAHRLRLVVLIAILIAFAYLLFPLGYVVATTLLFPAAAAALGSNRHVRDVVIGIVFAVSLYYAFSKLLGISLPQGVLPL